MHDMIRSIAALATLSGMGANYSSGRQRPSKRRKSTPEELDEREVARQKWAEIYNPTYASKPKWDDFLSRQAFRKALHKRKASHASN